MAVYDGKLKFNTAIDTSGFLSGIQNIGSIAQKGFGTIGNFAQTGIQALASFVSTSAENIKKSISLAIDGMKAVGDCVADLSKKAIDIGRSFESSMSQVAATMGITKNTIDENGVKPFDLLSEAAKKCGAETQFSASEAAEALNYLALAGYTAEQAADALPSVLNLAAAGGLELQYAADLATDAMAALGITANNQNLTEFGDKMAKAAQKSNTSISQLGEAILTVGGTAKELAGGTTELNTALGVLANVGIKGSEGGTALRNIMLAMTPTTDKAKEAFDNLKVSAYDMNGNLRPLNETFRDLNKAMSGMSSKERTETLNAIFNKVDLKSASAMLSACASSTEELANAFEYAGVPTQKLTEFLENFQNGVYNTMTQQEFLDSVMSDFAVTEEKAQSIYAAFVTQLNGLSWEKLENDINECDGAMQEMADTMNDNLEGDIKLWKSALEGLGITFYESIVDNLRATVQDATVWIGRLDEAFKADGFSGIAEEFPKVLSDMLKKAYLEIPSALDLGNEIIETVGNGMKENADLIKVYGSTLITKFAESFVDNFNVFYDTGFSVLTALISGLSQDKSRLADAAVSFVTGIAQTLENNLPVIFENGFKIMTAVADGLINALPTVIKSAKTLFSGIFKTVNSETGSQALNIVSSLAELIIENAPVLLDSGLELLENILSGISDGMCGTMSVISDFIGNICSIVTEHLPEMLQLGFDILMSLINGIADNLPLIADTAVGILLMLAKFIADNIGSLLDTAILIITMLCNELLTEENLQKIISAAFAIMKALAEGIAENLPLLVDCASQIIGEIMRYLNDENNRREILSSAGEVIGTLIKGLIDSLDEVVNFAAMLFVELGHAIEQYDWNEIGADIANGIMSGLLGVPFDGEEFKANFADNWISGMKDIFGIHSPSKLMRDEIGIYLVPGIAEGVADTSDILADELNSIIDDTFDNLDTERTIDIFTDADINMSDLVAKLESAVNIGNLSMLPLSAQINNVSDSDYGIEDIKNAIEQALENSGFDGTINLNVYIGQEKLDDAVINAWDRHNAKTGGKR